MNTITLNELPQLEDNFNTEESLKLNVMDLQSTSLEESNTDSLVELDHNQANPQTRVSTNTNKNTLLNKQQPTIRMDRSIKSTSCYNPNYEHMTRGIRATQGMLKGESRKRKREDDMISSEGVRIDVNEDTHISTPESSVP